MTQPAILSPLPPVARFLTLSLAAGADPLFVLRRLAELDHTARSVVGVGAPLADAAPRKVLGLHAFPATTGPGVFFPSTQGALYASFEGEDAGECLLSARRFVSAFEGRVVVLEDIAAFKYSIGRDLTGYEDGTENPKGDKAAKTALVSGQGEGLDGGSFVSVQRWTHDLGGFARLSSDERDNTIGRSRETNEELPDAPSSAHVKRTAQESFDPEAFLVRRSMPFGNLAEHGLVFVAFAATLDPFERQLRRMAGLDDGVTDALLRVSRALSGGHYFCPPLRGKGFNLSGLGF